MHDAVQYGAVCMSYVSLSVPRLLRRADVAVLGPEQPFPVSAAAAAALCVRLSLGAGAGEGEPIYSIRGDNRGDRTVMTATTCDQRPAVPGISALPLLSFDYRMF